jgi:hypothetical protein
LNTASVVIGLLLSKYLLHGGDETIAPAAGRIADNVKNSSQRKVRREKAQSTQRKAKEGSELRRKSASRLR